MLALMVAPGQYVRPRMRRYSADLPVWMLSGLPTSATRWPGIAGKVDRNDYVSRTGAARNQRRLVAASPSSAAHTAGVIFWFIRKKLVGSYLALSSVSRR